MNADEIKFLRLLRQLSPEKRRLVADLLRELVPEVKS